LSHWQQGGTLASTIPLNDYERETSKVRERARSAALLNHTANHESQQFLRQSKKAEKLAIQAPIDLQNEKRPKTSR
jgi:hypothetical protein